MSAFPRPLQELIDVFRRFPGVGEKSAQRFAFHLVERSPEDLQVLSKKIAELPKAIQRCGVCGMVDVSSPCRFDSDRKRDHRIICVVSETPDVSVIEQSDEYHGLYHVLGGVLNPLSGITPDKLRIDSLVDRVRKGHIREVILAMNPDLEGETTALHLKRALTALPVTVTRLGRGLPMGASLEYADEVTVANALKSRQQL